MNSFEALKNIEDNFEPVVDIEIVVIIITAFSIAILAVMAVGSKSRPFEEKGFEKEEGFEEEEEEEEVEKLSYADQEPLEPRYDWWGNEK